jgi:hypothetical protein
MDDNEDDGVKAVGDVIDVTPRKRRIEVGNSDHEEITDSIRAVFLFFSFLFFSFLLY